MSFSHAVTVAAVGLLSGCATQPAWVSAPPAAVCYQNADKKCLSELIAKNVIDQPAGAVRDHLMRVAPAVIAGAGVAVPTSLEALNSSLSEKMCLRPNEDYIRAGQAIELARTQKLDAAYTAAISIEDPAAQIFALRQITILATRVGDSAVVQKALNVLSTMNQDAYFYGLQARLDGLLVAGDLERTRALQELLLTHFTDLADPTHRVAEVAVSYAIAGYAEDGRGFVAKAKRLNPKVLTQDVTRMVTIVVKAYEGSYPVPQDFYNITSDGSKLETYLQLALLYSRTGKQDYSKRIVIDMARFVQRSSYAGDQSETAASLSRVLIETL